MAISVTVENLKGNVHANMIQQAWKKSTEAGGHAWENDIVKEEGFSTVEDSVFFLLTIKHLFVAQFDGRLVTNR